jgi:hypothetical protein
LGQGLVPCSDNEAQLVIKPLTLNSVIALLQHLGTLETKENIHYIKQSTNIR